MDRNYIFLLLLLIFYSCKEIQVFSELRLENNMILIPSGTLNMGGDNEQSYPNELPKHEVVIDSFWMDQYEVTNAQYLEFVSATNYITIAERELNWEELKKQVASGTPKPHDSILAPGALVFNLNNAAVTLDNPQLWWQWVLGANWKHPNGPKSSIKDIMSHPVVQLAWDDAVAYCKWAGKRLPTEAEWEWAARGGLNDAVYPWGNEKVDSSEPKGNFYQGLFPVSNSIIDGFESTAPTGSFSPNGYQLYDMAGNVWEWCSDWYDVVYYSTSGATGSHVTGPLLSNNPNIPYQQERVIRGGSFLCNESYCSGYRNARRMGSTPDTGLNHLGFRCAKDVSKSNLK